jgi:hypothetical protein
MYAKPRFFDMSAGKGDSPRPVNGPKYRANYDRIFSHKNHRKSLPPMPTFANICQQTTPRQKAVPRHGY